MNAGPVVVLSTFTSEPLIEGMRLAFADQGIDQRVAAGSYGQVAEALVGLAARRDVGSVVLVIRIADTLRRVTLDIHGEEIASYPEPDQDATGRTQAWVDDLVTGVADWCRTQPGPLILTALQDQDGLPAGVRNLCARLTKRVLAEAGKAGALVEAQPDWLPADPLLDSLAHLPFEPASLSELGARLALRVWRQSARPVKALVLDCDDTLWGGSCAEDGPLGVDRDGPYAQVAQLALRQREAGRLLCLASHNDEQDALAALDATSEGLRSEHVSAHRIGWGPKPVMLAELAEELGLGLDSFVFLDDNEVQRARMRHDQPEVTVPDFTPGAELVKLLQTSWLFDTSEVTDEDQARARRYDHARLRRRLEQAAPTPEEYVASLRVEATARPLDDDSLPRARQLLARTNQFAHIADGFRITDCLPDGEPHQRAWVVDVKDRIGDYGRVGVVADHTEDGALWVDALLLSCRVLGRGVEDRLVELIRRDAVAGGAAVVRAELVRTTRNVPIQDFLRRLASAHARTSPDAVSLTIPVDALACPKSVARLHIRAGGPQ